MRLADFQLSLSQKTPPMDLDECLQALWWAGKADWEQAHKIIQRHDGPDAAWVHAYLHRAEGDLPNARYWYGCAGRAMPNYPLDREWAEIVQSLLQRQQKVDLGLR